MREIAEISLFKALSGKSLQTSF